MMQQRLNQAVPQQGLKRWHANGSVTDFALMVVVLGLATVAGVSVLQNTVSGSTQNAVHSVGQPPVSQAGTSGPVVGVPQNVPPPSGVGGGSSLPGREEYPIGVHITAENPVAGHQDDLSEVNLPGGLGGEPNPIGNSGYETGGGDALHCAPGSAGCSSSGGDGIIGGSLYVGTLQELGQSFNQSSKQ